MAVPLGVCLRIRTGTVVIKKPAGSVGGKPRWQAQASTRGRLCQELLRKRFCDGVVQFATITPEHVRRFHPPGLCPRRPAPRARTCCATPWPAGCGGSSLKEVADVLRHARWTRERLHEAIREEPGLSTISRETVRRLLKKLPQTLTQSDVAHCGADQAVSAAHVPLACFVPATAAQRRACRVHRRKELAAVGPQPHADADETWPPAQGDTRR
jgi:hypothetical protein